MQLSVPQRTVADTGSFPVNPEGVTRWLARLRPLASETDAREVYRGLKHSNRLHNDVDRRRSVISCFVPVLRDLHRHLGELSNAQPLPLTREFARYSRLLDALLREEAFAFKILLSDSESALADDARRAMQALARQAESVVHAYRVFPDALLEDAHQLYALAEQHKLLSAHQGSELLSLQDHYRFILLLSVADLSQQRARQLPLVLDFLKEAVAGIHIERQRPSDIQTSTDYALDLKQGSRPEPARSLLSTCEDDVRYFSITPVLHRIDQLSGKIRNNGSSILGSDTLERQSLGRLHVALAHSRVRRLARCVVNQSQRAVFGHKEICAHMLYRPTETPTDGDSGWVVTNKTLQGVCLRHAACRSGLVQVGELVSITDPDRALITDAGADGKPDSGKIDAMVGVIRWVRANSSDSNAISVGIEFLARTVLPVHVTRRDDRHADQNDATAYEQIESEVGENALIIACKVQGKVLQTMLLPSFLYQSGDKLLAVQGDRRRKVKLHKCLQSNGLFSQYSLVDG